jgi:MFS family permease
MPRAPISTTHAARIAVVAPFRHLWTRSNVALVLIALSVALAVFVFDGVYGVVAGSLTRWFTNPLFTADTGPPVITAVQQILYDALAAAEYGVGPLLVKWIAVWGWLRALAGHTPYHCLPMHMARDRRAVTTLALLILIFAITRVTGGVWDATLDAALFPFDDPNTSLSARYASYMASMTLATALGLGAWLSLVAGVLGGGWLSPITGWRLCARRPAAALAIAAVMTVLGHGLPSLISTFSVLPLLVPETVATGALRAVPVGLAGPLQSASWALAILLQTSAAVVAWRVLDPDAAVEKAGPTE